MPSQEIASVLSATYNVSKIVGELLKLSKDKAVQDAVIELNGTILDLRSKMMEVQALCETLTRERQDLEQKLKEKENWDAEASKYQLHPIAPDMYVYVLKKQQAGEQNPYLCPHCFGQGKKSFLMSPKAGYSILDCHACKLSLKYSPPAVPTVMKMGRRNLDL